MVARKTSSSEDSLESLVDIFEAIKRALIRRGLIRGKPQVKASTQPKKGSEKLMDLTENAHDILFKANTVFPFNFFPDTVIVDREKLSLANRLFFRVAKISNVPIRDMLSVEADVDPFFGSVHISSRYFITNPLSITFLWKRDALKLQTLLQGYIIANEQGIDCSSIDKDQLITLLKDLGTGNTS